MSQVQTLGIVYQYFPLTTAFKRLSEMSIDAEKVSITVRIQIQIFLILDISHNYIGRF